MTTASPPRRAGARPVPGSTAQHSTAQRTTAQRTTLQDSSAGRSSPGGPGAGRLPGLDGLRAIAITAVVIFHLNPTWLPGGFLGVDIFFVVSGFLITTLLVREQHRHGRLDLRAFWGRRARRLLPALLLVLPVSVLLARITQSDLLVGVGSQVLGALTFSFNWVQIALGADYFHSTTPQLFMNFWSLAVEEQFYLLWPAAALLLLRWVRSSRARAGITLAIAGASALAMALLFDPAAGATRVYYGTDTHIFGLMLGASLAFWYAGGGAAVLAGPAWLARRRFIVAGAVAMLAALLWWLDESRGLTFRGGLVLASLVTAVLIAGAVSGGAFTRILDLPAMRWIGDRSYGIYLWHWPVILIVNADFGGVSGSEGYLWSRIWCVLVILALADLSYRFVESPVRKLGWAGAWRALAGRLPGSLPGGRVLGATVAVLALTTGVVIATAPAMTSTQAAIAANERAASRPVTQPSAGATPASTPGVGQDTAKGAGFGMPKGREIDAYGDSMMVGSVPALKYYFPGIRIDAKSNRRWSAGYSAIVASGHDIRRGVILSFGTNAGVEEDDLRACLDRLGPKRMIVLVDLHLNMARAKTDNATLARVAADYPNVIVAHWNAAVTAKPSLLQPDGIHPSMTGQHAYAAVVREAFADLSQAHTGKVVKLKTLPIP